MVLDVCKHCILLSTGGLEICARPCIADYISVRERERACRADGQ
jgi:hypothetical protein